MTNIIAGRQTTTPRQTASSGAPDDRNLYPWGVVQSDSATVATHFSGRPTRITKGRNIALKCHSEARCCRLWSNRQLASWRCCWRVSTQQSHRPGSTENGWRLLGARSQNQKDSRRYSRRSSRLVASHHVSMIRPSHGNDDNFLNGSAIATSRTAYEISTTRVVVLHTSLRPCSTRRSWSLTSQPSPLWPLQSLMEGRAHRVGLSLGSSSGATECRDFARTAEAGRLGRAESSSEASVPSEASNGENEKHWRRNDRSAEGGLPTDCCDFAFDPRDDAPDDIAPFEKGPFRPSSQSAFYATAYSSKASSAISFRGHNFWTRPFGATSMPRKASTWTLRLPNTEHFGSTASLPIRVKRRLSVAGSTISAISNALFPHVDGEKNEMLMNSLDIDAEAGPQEADPVDPARKLKQKELLHQRLMFGSVIFLLNATCIVMSAIGYSGTWVLCMILFFKSKDFFSIWIQIFCRLYFTIKSWFVSVPEQKASWILSLIPAYSESEEQIVKTLFSLRDNGTGRHRQVMCIILDGKPRDIKSHMTKVIESFEWKYVSLKWKWGVLKVDAGFVDDIPTLCIEKVPNAGKKDTLVLCHDLFNYPRTNLHHRVQSLRVKLWRQILPQLTGEPDFRTFDLVFCTDADSTIHQGALALLADACLADPKAIAACGFVFVEFEPGFEWSVWNLYQNFQYAFGQIVRRGAEHFLGKVTCLPGCITMIKVRPEMAGAIEKYASPVATYPVLRHQIQYLGTDRRLTYSMLSQGKHLHTLFIPEAGSETIAPQSLKHYLSQRRRWGSNAYFNNYWFCGGAQMIWITRLFAAIEIARLTFVYYRVFNTCLFLYGVAKHFSLLALLPMLIISFLPSFWFAFCVAFLNPHLRKIWFKLLLGFSINRCISPFMSLTVFSLVAKNLGSQVWGMTGGNQATATAAPAAATVAAVPTLPIVGSAMLELADREKPRESRVSRSASEGRDTGIDL